MDQLKNSHSQKAYKFYESLGSPKYICIKILNKNKGAPMVDQSELAFRMLCRQYGTTLAYTPMLHSRIMTTTKNYMNEFFTTCPQDRPLFAQFCGNDPDTILKAAQMVENHCDAIDINLGCPQAIAKRGNYGSFLLEKPEIIIAMVKNLCQNLKVPVTCKIRILKCKEKTIELAKQIQDAGCSILCVHGRTKEQNKETVGECDWDIIRQIKEVLSIPVFANGGIYTFGDVEKCLIETSVDGVMSAEALLENPALFCGKLMDLDEIAEQYMLHAREYRARGTEIRAHLFKILHTGLQQNTDLRDRLSKCLTYDDYQEVVKELQSRRKGVNPEEKIGWYVRYLKFKKPKDSLQQQMLQQESSNEQKYLEILI